MGKGVSFPGKATADGSCTPRGSAGESAANSVSDARGASLPFPYNTSTKVQKSTQVKFFAVKLNHIEIFTAKCYICDIFKYKLLHCSQQPND